MGEAEKLECSVCKEHARPVPARRRACPCDTRPFQEISPNVQEVSPESDMPIRKILNIVDISSRLHVAVPLSWGNEEDDQKPTHEDKEDAEVMERLYEKYWVTPYGPPDVAHFDPHGTHLSDRMLIRFQEDVTDTNPTSGEAHWEVGVVSRHGGLLKDRLDKMGSTFSPKTPRQFERVLQATV